MVTKSTVAQKLNTVSTKAAKAAAKAVQPHLESPKTAFEEFADSMKAARERYFAAIKAPTWKRQVVSFLLGVVAYAATFYYGMALLDMLALAVLSFSGPGFLSFLTVFVGITVLMIAGVSAGKAVYNAAMSFDYANAKSSVVGFFARFKKSEPAAA